MHNLSIYAWSSQLLNIRDITPMCLQWRCVSFTLTHPYNVISYTRGLFFRRPREYSWIHGANMGPIWGRQNPGRLHVGPMNFAIWDTYLAIISIIFHVIGPLWVEDASHSRSVTRSFGVFFDVRMNKRLNKRWLAGDLRRQDVHVASLYRD